MLMLRTLVSKLRNREEGVTAIEYALFAALIAVVIIATVTALGQGVDATLQAVTAALN